VEKQTTYRFNVTVTDTHGASATSETQVTQKPAATADNPQWISSKTYPKPCVKVSYQGKQWMNGWWTVGNVPGVDGTWGVWREIGDKNMHASCK
jgi:chitinase